MQRYEDWWRKVDLCNVNAHIDELKRLRQIDF
jgi:hypothetical protein